ncbi:MAG: SRPBCC domain-containing protein [Cyclobacteriaceae bacterium]|nr:SRPBCC domain-containing protein [Cyclobacteriaceae bacterium]
MNKMQVYIFLCVCWASSSVFAQAITKKDSRETEKSIKVSIGINSPLDSVWSRWTSTAGIRKFFAPSSVVEFRPLGSFNIYFTPDAPEGLKGAEGNIFLAIQEKQMLSFTWDAPPQWPEIRKQRTSVVIRFEKVEANKTQVTLIQSGWGVGKEWDEVYTYFGSAWGEVVLPFLKYSLEVAPVDWSDFPKNLPKSLPPAQQF